MHSIKFFFILSLISFLTACSEEKESATDLQQNKIIQRLVDPVKFSQGRKLYQLNCAKCHGKNAEGHKDWRRLNDNGKNPPPPLNGSGHTWHHSSKSLVNTIKNGTVKIGGNMPAWKDKLSHGEIKLILTWITAQWSDETYTAWYNRFHQEK